jgi:hypothetical protein
LEVATLAAKDSIDYKFEVVTGGRIAMQVERTCRLQGSVNLHDPTCHVDEIAKQIARAQHVVKPLD